MKLSKAVTNFFLVIEPLMWTGVDIISSRRRRR